MDIISMDTRLFDTLLRRMKAIEEKVTALCTRGEDLKLKCWLDNQEVCEILGITQRTLQTYRNKGLLAHTCIRHKIFYKPEDVESLLRSAYHTKTATSCRAIS